MKKNWSWEAIWLQAKALLLLKLRFALSGLVATLVDYGLYLLLVGRFLGPAAANVASYSCSMVLNFVLQRRFVFTLKRSVGRAFVLSMTVSLGGLLLSTLIVHSLSQLGFFAQRQYLTKLVATGTVFFYNFYLKRLVFERRLFDVEPASDH